MNQDRGDIMEIIIGEYVKDNTFAHKRIQIPDSEIEYILDVLERRIKIRATDLQKAHQRGYEEGYKNGYLQGFYNGSTGADMRKEADNDK